MTPEEDMAAQKGDVPMKDKKMYTEAEIEALAEKAAECAMEHFKHGLNCGECVVQGFWDLGLSDYPKEIVGLVSGMGGGMGFTHHTCGAVNAGLVVISSEKGRKNPYARETFAERVDELHHPGTGIYPRHGAYVKECIKEYGTMECRDLCLPFDESTPEGKKDRARNCKKLIGFCTREAVKAALRP